MVADEHSQVKLNSCDHIEIGLIYDKKILNLMKYMWQTFE